MGLCGLHLRIMRRGPELGMVRALKQGCWHESQPGSLYKKQVIGLCHDAS